LPSYSLSLSVPARNQYALLGGPDRREVRRLLAIIQLDPWIDNRHKVCFLMAPILLMAYVTAQFWILYHVPATGIRVTAIWRHAVNGQDY
jgi:hypothetical protein